MNRRVGVSLAALIVLAAGATGLLVLADSGAQHQTEQARPIQLGTSGGSKEHIDTTSNGSFCCGGTLGGLVEAVGGGTQYVLSNNHVLARVNRFVPGEDVVQPGLIDTKPNVCVKKDGDIVADLSAFVLIDFDNTNVVDAAIAQVRPGAVANDGSIIDIGPLSADTLAPSVDLKVKKSGRTSGLTTGRVASVAATVNVTYGLECGGPNTDTATFINQFLVRPGKFSAGGDSGSLIVEDIATNPRAVGLLFAGSRLFTIGNPINDVLSQLNVQMVGGTPPPPATTGSISGTVTSSADGSPIGGASVEADTGQSDTTAGDGSYTLTDVPTGDRTVTASAPGFNSDSKPATVNENQTTTVDFALNPVTTADSAIVECVTYTTSGGRNRDKHLASTVTVVDDLGNPVSGANVTATITLDGTTPVVSSATVTTDSQGNAAFTVKNASPGCYSTDVTQVESGLTFDGSEPSNGFAKGSDPTASDPTPDADCRSGSDDCGSIPFGKLSPADPQKMRAAIAVKRRYEALLFLRSKEVVGVGVSAVNGEPVIEVYLRSGAPNVFARIPPRVENIPIRPVVTGEFVARGQCPGTQ